MRQFLSLLACLSLLVGTANAEPQIPAPATNSSGIVPLTTGSATRLVPNPSGAPPVMCNSILIQSVAGNAALVYVLNAAVDVTMARNGAGTTTVAQLGVGTATVPGGTLTIPSNGSGTTQSGGIDMRLWGVSGTTGDSVIATCDSRQ